MSTESANPTMELAYITLAQVEQQVSYVRRLLESAAQGAIRAPEPQTIRIDSKEFTDLLATVTEHSPPTFKGTGVSAEAVIVDWVASGDRDWRAADLVEYLLEHTDLHAVSMDPKTSVYQALSRGFRTGKLSRPDRGVYGPLR